MSQKPAPSLGPRRVIAAASYSVAGARRLLREPAFVQELVAAGAAVALFAVVGATVWEWLGLAVLVLAVLAVEALNTAIEEVVDHLSPGWSEFARNAKDLGSFAVMCALAAAGLYVAVVVLT